jgi:glutamate 5-kinase
VNENDAIAISELVFSDNDELAGLIASQLDADAVIILTSVDGVMIGEGVKTLVVPEVYAETASDIEKYIDASISASGRGGMKTKFGVAKKLMKQGIVTHIVNGTLDRPILDAVDGKPFGTRFVPEKKLSAVKRRLAHAEGFAAGAAYVNSGAEEILLTKKAVSLLPVGVTRIEGSFKKGDVIEVRGDGGKKLGFGVAQYDSAAAKDVLGKKGARALIHCDYLFIGR